MGVENVGGVEHRVSRLTRVIEESDLEAARRNLSLSEETNVETSLNEEQISEVDEEELGPVDDGELSPVDEEEPSEMDEGQIEDAIPAEPHSTPPNTQRPKAPRAPRARQQWEKYSFRGKDGRRWTLQRRVPRERDDTP